MRGSVADADDTLALEERVTGIAFRLARLERLDETIDLVEEAVRALYAFVAPFELGLGRAHEHEEEARGIDAVVLRYLVLRHNVAVALQHLVAVLRDHALVEEMCERLLHLDEAHVVEHAREEPRVQEVHDRVLGAADILVDGQRAVNDIGVERFAHRVRRRIAQEIP